MRIAGWGWWNRGALHRGRANVGAFRVPGGLQGRAAKHGLYQCLWGEAGSSQQVGKLRHGASTVGICPGDLSQGRFLPLTCPVSSVWGAPEHACSIWHPQSHFLMGFGCYHPVMSL